MTEPEIDTSTPIPAPAGDLVIPTTPRRAWWHDALLAGLAISFFVHTALLLALALVLFDRAPTGDAGEGDEIQLAVMDDNELTEMEELRLDVIQPVIDDENVRPIFEVEALEGPLTDIAATEVDLSLIVALQNAGQADGLFSAGGTAKFFGIEAQGSRFVYIVDISGSMDGMRVQALKAALIASIDALSDESRFSIILFSDKATALTGDGWITISDAARVTARQRIAAISVGGGTNPVPAFDTMRSLRPLPDAVYFMTDGEFPHEVEERLLLAVSQIVRSGEAPMPIHAITFASRGAEALMRRLARMTRGSYTHVEGPRQ